MNDKLKSWIANKIYDLCPERFCWADVALWITGHISFITLLKRMRKPKGCIIDSMDDGRCYCGCWHCGHHASTFQGKRMIEQINIENENREAEQDPPL